MGSLLLVAAGCGVRQAPTAEVEPTPLPSMADASPATVRATPRVTFVRSGGIAGFHDRLILRPDGEAVLTSGRTDAFTCTVDKETRHRVGLAATAAVSASVDPRPKRSVQKPIPDLIYYTVIIEDRRYRRPSHAGTMPVDDRSVSTVFRLMHGIFESAGSARARSGSRDSSPGRIRCSS